VVGVSKPRDDSGFDLPLGGTFAKGGAEPRCGLLVIDLGRGTVVHWLWIEGVVRELYDVAILPGVRRPMALGFKTDEIRRTISMGPNPRFDAK
jgi:hypothetical protein